MAAAREYGGPKNNIVIWQWEGDRRGHFHDFEDYLQPLLEHAYINKNAEFKIPDSRNTVYLKHLYMYNEQTQLAHPVLRLVEPDCSRGKVCWQWQGDIYQRGRSHPWVPYNDQCSRALEASVRAAESRLDLESLCPGLPYIVDLSAMRQVNKKSGYIRAVRRAKATPNPDEKHNIIPFPSAATSHPPSSTQGSMDAA